MDNYTVYKHISPSGKVYIGITSKEPHKRWLNGRGYKNNIYFYRAIQKYGWDNFTHEILFENLSKDEACQKEIELIAEYKSNNQEFGYNISIGGNSGFYGCKMSHETKLKIGKISKENWQNKDFRNKVLNAMKNRPKPSKETREKMSKIRLGKSLKWKPVQNRIWINNKEIEKIIFPNELEYYKNLGFEQGRINGIHEGINNPMFGKSAWNKGKKSNITRWIYNNIETKRVSEQELEYYLQNGYKIGRKINKRRTKQEILEKIFNGG